MSDEQSTNKVDKCAYIVPRVDRTPEEIAQRLRERKLAYYYRNHDKMKEKQRQYREKKRAERQITPTYQPPSEEQQGRYIDQIKTGTGCVINIVSKEQEAFDMKAEQLKALSASNTEDRIYRPEDFERDGI